MATNRSRTRQAVEMNRRALVDAAVADTYQDRGDGWNAAHHRDMAKFHGKLAAELLAPPRTRGRTYGTVKSCRCLTRTRPWA